MAESVTEPGTDSTEEPGRTILEPPDTDDKGQTTSPTATTTPAIIWTPRFIAIFFLTLVAGLSAESLLTQGWLNDWVPRAIEAARKLQPLWSQTDMKPPRFEDSLDAVKSRFAGIVTDLHLDVPKELAQ